jgi:hypothetical protein
LLCFISHCKPDSNGRPDAEVAQEWWKNHLFREFSVIVALFSGQYKSVLTCEKTGFESARFEPFTCLQVGCTRKFCSKVPHIWWYTGDFPFSPAHVPSCLFQKWKYQSSCLSSSTSILAGFLCIAESRCCANMLL